MQHYHNDIVLLSSLYVSLYINNSRPFSFFPHKHFYAVLCIVVYVFFVLLSQRTTYPVTLRAKYLFTKIFTSFSGRINIFDINLGYLHLYLSLIKTPKILKILKKYSVRKEKKAKVLTKKL